MAALVIENLTFLPLQLRSLRLLLARWARALDALVSAQAARTVPAWRMRQLQNEIKRYRDHIRAGEKRHAKAH